MTLSNVKLIFAREIRDQLRDRRTLFMIAVLPILLYPLMGISLLQVSQFMQEQTTRVLLVGAKDIAGLPPLFDHQQFAAPLFTDPSRAKLLQLSFAAGALATRADAEAAVRSGEFDAALYFPPDFAGRLDACRQATRSRTDGRVAAKPPVPSPEIIYSTASDKSQVAFVRLSEVLRRWTEQIGDDTLAHSGVPIVAARPFLVENADVADSEHRSASLWSKILPVLLLLWALTGAFYPAIDLCAGEKERGTMETLLCSPAARSEIVLGKLATVMLVSIVTAVLNIVSVGITGGMVTAQFPGFGPPSLVAMVVLAIALVPISALFSALCLALAAFARSTKEGQYYLMPLLVITMPLVILPMAPGVELGLGTSLIPVTGLVLLLRSVLEGNYWQATQFSPTVAAVTMTACWLSIRWAIEQFNRESVLFRESERLDLGLRLWRLVSQRTPTPTVAAAVCCGVLILVIHFFLSISLTTPEGFGGFARMAIITQLGVIALPALLLTFLLTGSPRQTLLLKRPPKLAVLAAALLAVVLHPAATVLQSVVQHLYPVGDGLRPALEKMQAMFQHADFWVLVLVIALVPAVCEELAFRGFILSGFRHLGHKWKAIVLSALFFGVTHGILQQSLIACLMGTVLAYLAVQSGSILPGMAFHVLHNTLAIANGRVVPGMIPDSPLLRKFLVPADGGGCLFQWPAVVVGLLTGVLLLAWFGRLAGPKSREEELEDAIRRGQQQPSPLAADQAALQLGSEAV